MYKTIVTIWSEKRIPVDIDITTLAHAVDNGDEIGLGNIKCFKVEDYEADPDYHATWLEGNDYD